MIQQHVLIIGAVWVEPNSSAAGVRMLQLIETFLQNNYRVTFASAAQKNEKAISLAAIGVQETSVVLNDASFDVFIKDLQPTIVVFDRFMIEEQFGWRVAEHCPEAIRILDTEDLHFLRKVRHQQYKKNKAFTNKALLESTEAKREIAAILRCDISLIISTYEMELLTSVFKIDASLLHYIPFLIDTIDEETVNKWPSFNKREHFVFIGNFFHKPNVASVVTLKKHIWHQIRKQLPKAELHIYGAYTTPQILQLHNKKEGFLIKGFAENAEVVVKKAKVVLAPLQFGAGIKGKLTQAMVCGTPSVTTKIGAEGMHNALPWNGFVTDDMASFSESAIKLYTDEVLWNASQKNGTAIINSIYNKDVLRELLLNKITETQKGIETHRIKNFLGSMLQHQTLQATKFMSKWIEEKNK